MWNYACAVGLGKAYKGEGKHHCEGHLRVQHSVCLAEIKPLHMPSFSPDRCLVFLCEGYIEFLTV